MEWDLSDRFAMSRLDEQSKRVMVFAAKEMQQDAQPVFVLEHWAKAANLIFRLRSLKEMPKSIMKCNLSRDEA
jgi:hypothetical protein